MTQYIASQYLDLESRLNKRLIDLELEGPQEYLNYLNNFLNMYLLQH